MSALDSHNYDYITLIKYFGFYLSAIFTLSPIAVTSEILYTTEASY